MVEFESAGQALRIAGSSHSENALFATLGRICLTPKLPFFVLIGVACTLPYVIVYHVARVTLAPLQSNGLALASTAGLNFYANRKFTFRAHGGSILRQAGQYAFFYTLAAGVSTLTLGAFLVLWPQPSRAVELMAALCSTGVATMIRYTALSMWIFAPQPSTSSTPAGEQV